MTTYCCTYTRGVRVSTGFGTAAANLIVYLICEHCQNARDEITGEGKLSWIPHRAYNPNIVPLARDDAVVTLNDDDW